MKTMPVIRDELAELFQELLDKKGKNWKKVGEAGLELIPEMYRRSPTRRAAPVKGTKARKPLTDAKKRQILAYAESHPEDMLQDIAVKFGVNQGRISEIIAGFRV